MRSQWSIFATGNDDGIIKLFTYPAWTRGQEYVSLLGHGPKISRLLFTDSVPEESNGELQHAGNMPQILVSCGTNDRGIFIWEVTEE